MAKRKWPASQVVIDTEKLPPKGSDGMKRQTKTWDASERLVKKPPVKTLNDMMGKGSV